MEVAPFNTRKIIEYLTTLEIPIPDLNEHYNLRREYYDEINELDSADLENDEPELNRKQKDERTKKLSSFLKLKELVQSFLLI